MNTHRNCRIRMACGFNLIEVTIALAVVTIGIIGILSLLPHALDAARSATDRTVAATIVQQLIAELRGRPFDSLPSSPESYSFAQDGLEVTATNPEYFRVYITTAPKNVGGGSVPIRVVSATVYWRWPNPQNSEVFVTEIARYDP